ncbi:DUF2062 domain-containing protein [Pseudomonas sp. dw_358]|uniref:DUF2062 domain-containing protein n=1 Tax=Pseudomonas sp. dw_358 TaxID=2720083 RepID=UPI001BD33475|nr:DUF2062 domain-containing protein [Pseudomonas sp. dw_358]
MPRRLFKRYMPDPARLRGHKSLRVLGHLLDRPNLWHLNRRSVARAMGIGCFTALLPIPLQMLAAAMLAVSLRANLAISVSLVWLTNPLTMPVVFYGTYQLGAWLLHTPARNLPDGMTWEWLSSQLGTMWQPFVLGSLVTGVVLGGVAYGTTRGYWEWRVRRQWQRRQRLRCASRDR